MAAVVELRPTTAKQPRRVVKAPALQLTPYWEAVGHYERALRVGKSESTVKGYHAGLRDFASWCEQHEVALQVEMLERAHVEQYLVDLRQVRSAAPKTVLLRYATLHAFFAWLVELDILDDTPMKKMHRPKVPEKPVQVVRDESIERLVASCNKKGFLNRRDHAMFLLLKETGIRRGELCGMLLADVEVALERRGVTITGKTGTRFHPFSDETADALTRYLLARKRERYAHLGELWISYYGRLNPGSLNRVITRRAHQAGIPTHLHPHLFRHTWAHKYKAAGGTMENLMELGGWSSMEMVRHYGKSDAVDRAVADYRRRMFGEHPKR